MERPQVGKIEKKVVNFAYRTFQRLNPLIYIYEPIISKETKKYSEGTNVDGQSHSIYSDGDTTPDHEFKIFHRRGIEAFALTDHDTIQHWKSCERAELKYPNTVNIPAIEISTRGGDILGYFPSYDCKNHPAVKELASGKKYSIEKTIDLIHEAGGVAIAPHPNKSRGIGLRELIILSNKLDGVEAINTEAGENECETIGQHLGIACIGSSDSHCKVTKGSAFTHMPDDCYKNSFENGKLNKDKFRRGFLDCIREERPRIKEGLPPKLKPFRAISSGIEQNIGKTSYSNPFLVMLKFTEYFLDKDKTVAKRLEACLEE
jgi:hypothetical protein